MYRWLVMALAFGAAGLGHAAAAEVELKVGRFFGACSEIGTEIDRATGEACIMQAILNAFSGADNGIRINMLPASWDRYYDQLRASYAEGTPPDVHVLHRHRMREFADLGVLAPLGDDLEKAGIDVADWAPAALDAVKVDGTIYGLPFDMHANLWHMNLALLAEAGLVGGDGRAVLPESPGELLEQARQVRQATGKAYLAADFTQFPIGVRAVLSLLWQQNRNVFDGSTATIDTPEMRAAITTVTDLFQAGYADPSHDYERAQQAFLDGEVAVLINGTWAVDLYDKEASKAEVPLSDYDVAEFPTLFDQAATWADAHLWAIPASLKAERPEVYDAALQLLAWINERNLDWARTGHIAIRRSVLDTEAYATLPHRLDYRRSIEIGRDIPPTVEYNAIQDALMRGLQAIWLGKKTMDEALAATQAEVQALLR